MKSLIAVILLLISSSGYSQQKDEFITVVGDSLIGRMTGGETTREVIGNVVLTQGDVRITCNRAIQFISRNEAELIGNVHVRQDSLTIITERGFYYGNTRRAESTSGVILNDQKVILTADTGDYFFNEDRAFFKSNVRLYDTATVLTSYELTYFRHEDRMVSAGDVKIVDSTNVIEADSLEHFRKRRITLADKNVKITSNTNNVVIYGDHLEDYAQKFYTLINENPLLIQIDTTWLKQDTSSAVINDSVSFRLDTLIIKSLIMESFRDTINIFKAVDSVEIIRGDFASVNDESIYYRKEGKIVTSRVQRGARQPVLWNANSQLTGDSVVIHIADNSLRLLEVISNAFLNSQNTDYPERFDQVSGDNILMHFENGKMIKTDIEGNEFSIYYLYEDNFPNGVNKASSRNAAIYFEEQKVSSVHLYGSPVSEYYPEHQVIGKEKSFTLPGFIVYENRPVKDVILNSLRTKSIL